MDRNAVLEEAAKVADLFEDENFRMAHDTLLLDPALRGGRTQAAIAASDELQIDGAIATSMAHAARNIAAAIRNLKLQ